MLNPKAAVEYQRQDIASASPAQLVTKLYDLAIVACHRNDRSRLRKVLIELISALNFEDGGDLAVRLSQIYEYCMRESIEGDIDLVAELLSELRETWKQGLTPQHAAV